MVFVTGFFALIPFVIPAALVIPVALAANQALTSRTPGVFACTGANFTGDCSTFNHTSGECVNFPAPFNNNIGSFSTDDGNCQTYLDPDCCGPYLNVTIASPRYSFPPEFENAISSFRCSYDID
ncbi:hypothetical protein B0H11DRAFT_2273311 [Mycena galericulata]|nr:hypothetical protein B0H11DRAFT_2273311 [Mycena galericulata]